MGCQRGREGPMVTSVDGEAELEGGAWLVVGSDVGGC